MVEVYRGRLWQSPKVGLVGNHDELLSAGPAGLALLDVLIVAVHRPRGLAVRAVARRTPRPLGFHNGRFAGLVAGGTHGSVNFSRDDRRVLDTWYPSVLL